MRRCCNTSTLQPQTNLQHQDGRPSVNKNTPETTVQGSRESRCLVRRTGPAACVPEQSLRRMLYLPQPATMARSRPGIGTLNIYTQSSCYYAQGQKDLRRGQNVAKLRVRHFEGALLRSASETGIQALYPLFNMNGTKKAY